MAMEVAMMLYSKEAYLSPYLYQYIRLISAFEMNFLLAKLAFPGSDPLWSSWRL